MADPYISAETERKLRERFDELAPAERWEAFLAGFKFGYANGWAANAQRILKEMKGFKP